jgi:hypothetical protein
MKRNGASLVSGYEGGSTMMIFMLAAVMTLAMLIATAFALHGEAQAARLDARRQTAGGNRFG